MDGGTLYTIGDLARRTGLSVKTIRFYSDQGIVPPVERSPAGYRLYDAAAAARLDLVRTLRDLDVDLATVRKVVDRELTLAQVAAAHAEALAVRIRTLRLRHAVLTAVARRGSGPKEMELMHRLAKLSQDERRRLVGDFLDAAVPDVEPGLAGARVSMTPELPDDAEPEQVEAWVELAELMADPSFRTAMRDLTTSHASDRAADGGGGVRRDAVSLGLGRAGAALAAGVDPAGPEAAPVVAAVAGEYARLLRLPDDAALRRRLLARLEAANDPRRERYLRLLAVINAWPPPASSAPALDWLLTALHTHPAP
ncbi:MULTISPECIES: MerR family transcriptional regulator [unclassified Nonomuraea]|uniref:MerR family transcriptional regulator n=1 Tax=unclassified Nonomuraea TaxID=2593643 RepID=UPI0033EEC6A5